jgi:hypothetical protein
VSGPTPRVPLGYLGFFDLKNSGVNPSQLTDFVQPVFSIDPLYRAGQWVEQRAQIVLAGAAGLMQFSTFTDGTSAVVPERELWWCDDFSITAARVAADQLCFLPAIRGGQQGASPFTYIVGEWSLGASNTAQTTAGLAGVSSRSPFLISPGGNFSVIVVDGNAAGLTRTLTAHMRFVKMRI